MEPDIYQRIFTVDQVSGSGIQPILSSETPNPSNGYVIVSESLDKSSPTDLLKELLIPTSKKRSYELAEALFDNYNLSADVPDDITPQESAEVDLLLEHIIDRAPMRVAREYIENRTARSYSDPAWYAYVKETWFQPFQVGTSPTRSGFEHVFMGEDKEGKIGGLHWWYYYHTKMKNITYGGAIYTNMNEISGVTTPEIATLTFSWNVGGRKILKPIGGFFIGPSVEGLMAMGMVRANAGAAAPNIAVIEGVEVELKLFKSPNERSINTFYPVFKRLITGVSMDSSVTRPQPSNPSPFPSGLEHVRLISAITNPEGDDVAREKVTLINLSGRKTVNLNGWRVVGPNKSSMVFGEVLLEPGNASTFLIPTRSTLQLSNKGGTISIVDPGGTVIHAVKYSNEVARLQGRVLIWDRSDALIDTKV